MLEMLRQALTSTGLAFRLNLMLSSLCRNHRRRHSSSETDVAVEACVDVDARGVKDQKSGVLEQRRNEVPKEWTMEIGKAGIKKEE